MGSGSRDSYSPHLLKELELANRGRQISNPMLPPLAVVMEAPPAALSFFKPHLARLLLLACCDCEGAIQLRPAGADPAAAGALGDQGQIEIGDHHAIGWFVDLCDRAAVGVEDHGVAGANFVVVDAYAVGEKDEQSVVVGAGGEPAQEPFAAIWAQKLGADGGGIYGAIVPESGVDGLHAVRAGGVAAAGLVGGEENLRAALFNLLPVPPLDGGRVTAAVSPWIWMVGLAALVALILSDLWHQSYAGVAILVLVLFYAIPRVRVTLRARGRDIPYYRISRLSSFTIGALYLALAVSLLALLWLTHGVELLG